jgi:hypothetical protein
MGHVVAEIKTYYSMTCGSLLAWGIGWNWLELACNRLQSVTNGLQLAAIGLEWAGIGKQ